MTRIEFYKKCKPVFDGWLYKMRENGYDAVDNAFKIAVVKEVLFRLAYDSDDQNDEVPEFKEMTPEFFLQDVLDMADNWDNIGEIFVTTYDQAYEMFCEMVKTAGKDWEARNEDEEQV